MLKSVFDTELAKPKSALTVGAGPKTVTGIRGITDRSAVNDESDGFLQWNFFLPLGCAPVSKLDDAGDAMDDSNRTWIQNYYLMHRGWVTRDSRGNM